MAILSYWHVFGLFLMNKQVHVLSCLYKLQLNFHNMLHDMYLNIAVHELEEISVFTNMNFINYVTYCFGVKKNFNDEQ